MTTITVTAADTAQAMDKIVERLGEDALILETVKRNGRIEMVATDDSNEHVAEQVTLPTKNTPEDGKIGGLDIRIGANEFTDLFDQQMINSVHERTKSHTKTQEYFVGRANSTKENFEIINELKTIQRMLNGMMITKPDGLDITLGYAAPVRLHQAGFSSEAIQELYSNIVGLKDEEAIASFINALAKRVVHRNAESVFDSRVVFVLGSSGTGKTTLATKIAAYFKENGISERITLAAAAGPGIHSCEDIKVHARLLNMRSGHFGIGDISTAIQETSNRMIIDVNASPEDSLAAIREVKQNIGSKRVTVVQALPGGCSATMISHQCQRYRSLNPMIALTKLDECEAMPAELSALAMDGSGVGLLTGTKSIVGGIAIATVPILSQYLIQNIAY